MADPGQRKWRTLRDYSVVEEVSEAREEEKVVIATVEEIQEEEAQDPVVEEIESEDPAAVEEPESESEEAVVSVSDRVLLALPNPSTSRLFRETLSNFTTARIDSTADTLRAFEMALQRRYRLFVFAMSLEEMSGPMLYEFISKARATGYGKSKMAPGVVFVREEGDSKLSDELLRDARVRDVLAKPLKIDRILKSFDNLFELRDPTQRG